MGDLTFEKICVDHGVYREPSCPKCQNRLNRFYRDLLDAMPKKEKPMTQPTPEQLRDPQWWDENDTTGGKATHVCATLGWFGSPARPGPCDIPRPKSHPTDAKPADGGGEGAVEWDGGVPLVDFECEYRSEPREGQTNFADDWERCRIKYRASGGVVIEDTGGNECFMDFMDYRVFFRPIRSQAEREREEVISEARAKAGIFLNLNDALGRIYDAGMLSKAQPSVSRSELSTLYKGIFMQQSPSSGHHFDKVAEAILSRFDVLRKGGE